MRVLRAWQWTHWGEPIPFTASGNEFCEGQSRKVSIPSRGNLNSVEDTEQDPERYWDAWVEKGCHMAWSCFSRLMQCLDSIDWKSVDDLQSVFLSVHVEIRSQYPLSSGLGFLIHNWCWLLVSQHSQDQGALSKSPINERLFLGVSEVIYLSPLLIVVPKWVAEAWSLFWLHALGE